MGDRLWHVTCRPWDGRDLIPLAQQTLTAGALRAIAERYDIALGYDLDAPDGEWIGEVRTYIEGQGGVIHCHATLAEARAFAREWAPDGSIIEIDADGLDVRTDTTEYPHPVIAGRVGMARCSVVD